MKKQKLAHNHENKQGSLPRMRLFMKISTHTNYTRRPEIRQQQQICTGVFLKNIFYKSQPAAAALVKPTRHCYTVKSLQTSRRKEIVPWKLHPRFGGKLVEGSVGLPLRWLPPPFLGPNSVSGADDSKLELDTVNRALRSHKCAIVFFRRSILPRTGIARLRLPIPKKPIFPNKPIFGNSW